MIKFQDGVVFPDVIPVQRESEIRKCPGEQKYAIVLKKQGESDILSPSFYENTVVVLMVPWLKREEQHHGQAENLSSE